MIKFNVQKKYRKSLDEVVNRVAGLAARYNVKYSRLDIEMDLSACHSNGNPLDFERMVKADDFNLGHDAFGIRSHINRTTGKLEDLFLPRFSALDLKDKKLIEFNKKLGEALSK